MSQNTMDSEIFSDFIVEAKEHLETIEPNLLELEKSPGNLSLLNEIFRPMHSLKGASGFLGLPRINGLAHRAENILDELRKGTMQVSSEIMDVILAATDALRQIIEHLELHSNEGDTDTESIITMIDQIMAGELPAVSKPVDGESKKAELALQEQKPAAEAIFAENKVSVQDSNKIVADDESEAGAIWISGLEPVPTYSLTAFGAGHLKDFIDEALELIENLSTGLLRLETEQDSEDIVNDLFRYFHNLKGNSGIIDYKEINELTHAAETLLNIVRKGEIKITSKLVDLLLLSVDVLDKLVASINFEKGTVTPVKITELKNKLDLAAAGGGIDLPFSWTDNNESENNKNKTMPVASESEQEETSQTENSEDKEIDSEDLAIFKNTIGQLKGSIDEALAQIAQDASKIEYIDALYRTLSTIQNSCNYMGYNEARDYAKITGDLVNQGRKSGIDFSLMLDILKQECAILIELIDKVLLQPLPSDVNAQQKDQVKIFEKEKTDINPESSKTKETEQGNANKSTVAPSTSASLATESVTKKPETQPISSTAFAATANTDSSSGSSASTASSGTSSVAVTKVADTATTAKASSTIRVDHEKLDHLMNLIGELIINRNRYSLIVRQLEAVKNSEVGEVAQNLSETTYAMARISDELQDTIMKVRMVPVSSVFSRFPRLVRDLSRKSGKDVDLIMEGEDTELDKSVVEVIGDPLVHLIRNSMDHGIESAEVRVAKNKSPKGQVWLRAYHKGNSVAIEIEDDGAGIDPEKMREVGIRKGIITSEEAKTMDDREAIELIFAPGFSSAEKITDISGRGVGMDVVRTNIKNLKGSVNIHSEIGKGTRFTLSLPLTLAIIDALMVNVGNELYAIPLDAVSETTKIEASRLTDVKGRKAVTLRGEVLGITELSTLLGLPSSLPHEVLSVVVIHDNDRRLGLAVDSLLERQEIVIKPLGEYLGDLKGISGATILGDGGVILILDPHEIYAMATSKAL